ncbi:MAG: bifunctional 3-deoxy-7-phosphoheptulonate synthase/chorismate mutase type II [Sphingobacteriaceae bacterium]|nr:bifunctional 3-deoxy-7-phosphoheptulonate synthase/chorismate mutase type II [Sphingobacteriaceae bacterium]
MDINKLTNWLQESSKPLLISGPCGAESYDQLRTTALELSQLPNLFLFRAGIWKPRTRPDSFEGMGDQALDWLNEVKKEFKIKTTVEVANATHVEKALKKEVDVLWIGARTTVNPFTVQEIADAMKGSNVPVLIKNPIHADLNLWVGAIERFLKNDITKIAAVHRGFYKHGQNKYRNEPMWQIPIALKTHFPDLAIFCDPSHISGNSTYLQEIAQKALDLRMNGLMIETHPNPAMALSDAKQQITPEELKVLLQNLVIRKQFAKNLISADELLQLRNLIDEVDEEILEAIGKRNEIIGKIGKFKKENNVTIFQLERWQEILRTRAALARKIGISPAHIEKIFQLLHEESMKIQNEIMNKKN